MKKLNLIGALLLSSVMVFAQDTETTTSTTTADKSTENGGSLSFTSKNGHEVLPQAGDWAIGIGASNALGYFGNLFTGAANANGDNAFSFANENLPSQVIFGKYMVSSELAYRGYARLNYNRVSTKAEVDADLNPNPDVYVTDKRVTSTSGITLGAGLEKRRGMNRLVGVYGAQAFINLDQSTKTKYEYGNALSVQNPNPTGGGLQNSNTVAPNPAFGQRLVKTSLGSSFGVGAQAFIGAEYYFAPKMSIGGEFYWGLTYTNNPVASETWEALEPTTGEVTEYVSNSVGGSQFNAGLSNLGGAINLFLYF